MRPLGHCLTGLGSLALASCTLTPPAQPDALPAEVAVASATVALPPEPAEKREDTPSEPASPIWRAASDGTSRQHIASGYICPARTNGFVLMDVETFPGLGRGNDVACVYSATEGGNAKLHLTHFGREVRPSAHLKGVQTSLTEGQNIIGQAPLPILKNGAAIETAAAYQIAATSALRPDVPIHTAVWIQQVNGWHIKVRATYEADREVEIGQLVGTLMGAAESVISPQTPASPP